MDEYLWRGWETWALTGAIIALPWWLFSSIPYWVARTRRIESVAGVRILGVFAIFLEGLPALFMLDIGSLWIVGPLCGGVVWVLALIWAVSGQIRKRTNHATPVAARYPGVELLGQPTPPPIPRIGPGWFRISGVDQQTRYDMVWRCVADTEANARVKAELEGIIVTAIERED